ncbi:MAG: zeta toxin family protein [Gammaproteobacteria bacterium]|nr:zeta toxin family protein [Gammaproteobacteria bacterium]
MPKVVVIAGPNGAGKSTAAKAIVRGTFGVAEFVNADDIARGLSGFSPESAALRAGRAMLSRLEELTVAGADFAFETTLASRTFAPRIRQWGAQGYRVELAFLWLPTADMAADRRVP